MNAKRNIRRKLVTLFAAAAFSAPVLSLTQSASALTYVNLLDGTTSNSIDNGPSSLSHGTTSGPAISEPMPVDQNTQIAQFMAYANQVEAWRAGVETKVLQQVAALDQEIHKWHVERQMALSTYHARRNEPAAQQFYASRYQQIQNYICQLQTNRWNLLTEFYNANQATFEAFKARDPRGYGQWYDAKIRQNEANRATAAAQARATYGLPQ